MSAERRRLVYCLVPEEAAPTLLEPLRAFYKEDDRVEVVVDRRMGPRRTGADRREGVRLSDAENRREEDRRQRADRRCRQLPRRITAPPDELGGPLRWAERLVPLTTGLENADGAELASRLRNGDADASTELYWRVGEKVRARLEQLLGDAVIADAAVPAAVGRLIDALERETPLSDFSGYVERHVDAFAAELPGRPTAPGEPDPLDDPARRIVLNGQLASLRVHGLELQEPIVLRHHDPAWIPQARAERTRLRGLLGGGAIEHVGGTAVPDLDARPVIDLVGAVDRMPPPQGVLDALASAGYQLVGEAGVPGRLLARRRNGIDVDLHLVDRASQLWTGALALRDLLRADGACRARCGEAKWAALSAAEGNPYAYAQSRAEVFDELTAEAIRRLGRG